jgi:cytochrome c oxidase cbb3-type subunit 2/cytochrome c oxidase cbb3-type subunit I/II
MFAFLNTTIFCNAADGSANSAKAITSETKSVANVHSIVLPHFDPELLEAPGRDQYLQVCVSCHSPRYVTMQPPFPQRQWEETVDKMAKVYGAQIDQNQRASIVQYLVATRGPDSSRAPARDEDSDFAPAPKPKLASETAPVLTLIPEGAARGQELEHGAELFKRDCAGCHGANGRGDGFVAHVLLRKPKNLAAIRYSVNLLSHVLWNGKRGTAMPSWRGLAQNDLSALAAYVQSLHPPAEKEEISADSLQHGKPIFLQNCAPCHGETGDGKGPAAATLMPEPANFKLKQPDYDYILQVLNEGIPGTGMPAWNQQISEPDRRALADFLRSLFNSDSSNNP